MLALLVFFLMFSAYIYFDIKKVEQGVFNLYQQMKTTNDKITQFSVSDEEVAQKSMKFTEATKQWRIYQNSDHLFQFKSPANWGSFIFETRDDKKVEYYSGQRLYGGFTNAASSNSLDLMLVTYDFSLPSKIDYASREVQQAVEKSEDGECPHDLFESLKKLNIGEIRNCYVQENILNQKFIVFHYVQVLPDIAGINDEVIAVCPRGDYYIKIDLPNEISPEIEYFIQSVVFLN